MKDAPEELEDEDLVEMVNAGLVGIVVLDKHVADFWKRVFPRVKVYDAIPLRTGGHFGLIIRRVGPFVGPDLRQRLAPCRGPVYPVKRPAAHRIAPAPLRCRFVPFC